MLLQHITILCTSWPSVTIILTLVVIVFFKPELKLILRNISIVTIKFKDLTIMLQDPNVPDKYKVLITNMFMSQLSIPVIQKAITKLQEVIKSVRKLEQARKNANNPAAITQAKGQAADTFEDFASTLDLFPEKIHLIEKKKKLREFGTMLRTPSAYLEQANTIVDVLQAMDPNFAEKDPRDYLFIQELEEELLKILSTSEKAK